MASQAAKWNQRTSALFKWGLVMGYGRYCTGLLYMGTLMNCFYQVNIQSIAGSIDPTWLQKEQLSNILYSFPKETFTQQLTSNALIGPCSHLSLLLRRPFLLWLIRVVGIEQNPLPWLACQREAKVVQAPQVPPRVLLSGTLTWTISR